jgi:hypothetical protein
MHFQVVFSTCVGGATLQLDGDALKVLFLHS